MNKISVECEADLWLISMALRKTAEQYLKDARAFANDEKSAAVLLCNEQADRCVRLADSIEGQA